MILEEQILRRNNSDDEEELEPNNRQYLDSRERVARALRIVRARREAERQRQQQATNSPTRNNVEF